MRLGSSREQHRCVNEPLPSKPGVSLVGTEGDEIFRVLCAFSLVSLIESCRNHGAICVKDHFGRSSLADFFRQPAIDSISQQHISQSCSRGSRSEIKRLNGNFIKIAAYDEISGLRDPRPTRNERLRKLRWVP